MGGVILPSNHQLKQSYDLQRLTSGEVLLKSNDADHTAQPLSAANKQFISGIGKNLNFEFSNKETPWEGVDGLISDEEEEVPAPSQL